MKTANPPPRPRFAARTRWPISASAFPESGPWPFVGSDGVDDSYTSDEELFSLYRELCLTGINQGGDAVQEAVKDFLPVLTERGSMDDVSIAGVMNCAAMQPLKEKLTQERETLLAARRAEEAQRQLKRLNMKREQLQKELDRKANI